MRKIRTSSPFRYPGGKSAMAGLLSGIRQRNGLGDRPVAEPFAGGAGASLSLLYLEETHGIHINDADPSIYDFWWSVVNDIDNFTKMLDCAAVDLEEWYRQRDIYRNKSVATQLHRGFASFYLNRCNRSGIIMNGGPIGGTKQAGKWKIGARFNKINLRKRCEKIYEYRDRIKVSCQDGIEFIDGMDNRSTFFFIDPPYYEKGKMLYLNALDDGYHAALASRLEAMKDAAWVLTYDDCPQIRRLYSDWATIRPFSLRYAAAERRAGNEVLIVPKWMELPSSQTSAAITW